MLAKPDEFVWKWHHTALFTTTSIVNCILLRSVMLFNFALADILNVDVSVFFVVNIASFVGVVCCMFAGVVNEKYINNTRSIYKIYTHVGGISSILFCFPFLFPSSAEYLTPGVIIFYLSLVWLVYSITFQISTFAAGNLAKEYNTHNEDKHGALLSILLSAPWCVASMFSIVMGYAIDYLSGYFFLFFGFLLIVLTLVTIEIYIKPSVAPSSSASNASDASNSSDALRVVANDTNNINDANDARATQSARDLHCLFRIGWLRKNPQTLTQLLSVYFVAISVGTTDVIVNPIFMSIYGSTASEAGIYSLIIFAGEFVACALQTKYSDSWSIFTFIKITFWTKLFVALSLILVVLASGQDLPSMPGSLGIVIVLIGIWYFAWELFWVANAIGVLKFCESKKETSERMLFLTVSTADAVGRMTGVGITSLLWKGLANHSSSVMYASMLWLVTVAIGAGLYYKLYKMQETKVNIELGSIELDDKIGAMQGNEIGSSPDTAVSPKSEEMVPDESDSEN